MIDLTCTCTDYQKFNVVIVIITRPLVTLAKTITYTEKYITNLLLLSLLFVRQSEMLIPEEELGSQSPVSYEKDFEDLSSNVDLYVFNDQMVEGYRVRS